MGSGALAPAWAAEGAALSLFYSAGAEKGLLDRAPG